MEQLSGQDASFVYLETPTSPMHVGSVTIYDQSSLPEGVQRFTDILNFTKARLHKAKTFRQKMVKVPFSLDHPYWIEDKDFDLEFHMRHIRLPAPGDWRQLCIQVARIHSRPLDLTKPPWEMTVLEGLDNIEGLPKNCYAVITKIHHASIDGMSGVDITEALHDLTIEPQDTEAAADPWSGEESPTAIELLSRAAINNTFQPFRFAKVVAQTVPAVGRLVSGLTEKKFSANLNVPKTRFNRAVTAQRVFEGRSFDLNTIRAIKKSQKGATVNDAVLTICGGAIRRYLSAKDELPENSLIAMAPISVRSSDEKGALGNQVAAMTVAIGTDIEDPVKRLKAVHKNATSSKEMTNALGAKLMTDYNQFIPSTVAGLATRLYTRTGLANRTRPVFNCVITNIPGPQVPLYSAGAEMVTQFGLAPVFDSVGLIFPVVSYNGTITISFTSCREMVPDPEFLSECLQASYDELVAATT